MLDAKKVQVKDERLSRKNPLSDAEALALLRTVDRVLVAKGKAVRELRKADATLDDLRGPTGNIRAPLVIQGKTLLVGFNPEALASLLGQ